MQSYKKSIRGGDDIVKMIDVQPLRSDLQIIEAKLELSLEVLNEADSMPVASLMATSARLKRAEKMLSDVCFVLSMAMAQLTNDDVEEYAETLGPTDDNEEGSE